MKYIFKITFFIILVSLIPNLYAKDWPIFKGNIYFTGNNDEIIVKNNNLKWLFQADARAFNPIVSEGKIYLLDKKSNIYCLDEEYGKLLWKINMSSISRQFKSHSRAAGKIKYPLIKGNTLFLTDPIAIYAIDKRNGRILWARTGMRIEKTPTRGLVGRRALPMVDGIYSNPMILDNEILYGTRKMLMTRSIQNGHIKWENRNIRSYSGFPTIYDKYVITQSMNYTTNKFTIYCLESNTGKEVWSKTLKKPFKIFPPVVYKEKIYIPTGKEIYCLNLKNGNTIWSKKYKGLISSIPSFTDRAILFSIDNSDIAVISPKNGKLLKKIKVSKRSGPKFVTTRDQVYIAYHKFTNGKKKLPFGHLKAKNFSDNSPLWEFKAPFPGAVSQPVSSNGIIFFPAGNYLYAVGTEYGSRITDGGSGFSVNPKNKDKWIKPPERNGKKINSNTLPTRKIKMKITDSAKNPIPSIIEVIKRRNGKIIYHKKIRPNSNGELTIPKGKKVELIITSKDYIPKKVTVKDSENKKDITLYKIEIDKNYVIDNINFELNKAYLKKNSLNILNSIIDLMKRKKSLKLKVSGHTDSVGNSKYNQQLSEKRADSVIEYMVKNGISPARLTATGYGETKPIATNKTKNGRAKNRRTEFIFTK